MTRSWNVGLVSQLLIPFERDRIVRIPISSRMPNDTICWDLESDDEFSIRATYRAMFKDEWTRDEVTVSSPLALCQQVWRLKALPRVKVFAWRAGHEALPTRLGISKRISGYMMQSVGV